MTTAASPVGTTPSVVSPPSSGSTPRSLVHAPSKPWSPLVLGLTLKSLRETPPWDWHVPPPPLPLSRTALSTAVQEFAIVPLHAAPLDAVAEMDALYDVYLDVRQKWDLEVSPRPWALGARAVCPGQAAAVSCRPSCSWATSMQAAATWPPPSGPPSACARAQLSSG